MKFSAKITAVAVLILNLDYVKELPQVIKTISESGLSSSLFISIDTHIYEEYTLFS